MITIKKFKSISLYNVRMSAGKLMAIKHSLERDKAAGKISTIGQEVLDAIIATGI